MINRHLYLTTISTPSDKLQLTGRTEMYYDGFSNDFYDQVIIPVTRAWASYLIDNPTSENSPQAYISINGKGNTFTHIWKQWLLSPATWHIHAEYICKEALVNFYIGRLVPTNCSGDILTLCNMLRVNRIDHIAIL